MIHIYDVKCSGCGVIVQELCNDKRKPRRDYLCPECLQKKSIDNMIFEEIDVKEGNSSRFSTYRYKVFMGFKELIPDMFHKNHYFMRGE